MSLEFITGEWTRESKECEHIEVLSEKNEVEPLLHIYMRQAVVKLLG